MIPLVICFRKQRLVLFIMLRQSFHQAVRSKLNTPSAHGTEMECEKQHIHVIGQPQCNIRLALSTVFFVALDGWWPQQPGVPGNLKTLWLLLMAAAFFVSHRLKSPFGSASASSMT